MLFPASTTKGQPEEHLISAPSSELCLDSDNHHQHQRPWFHS